MPLTASKTEADTSATTRLVTNGLVPPARTAVFMTPIHSSTESGVVQADSGMGLVASSATINVSVRIAILTPTSCRRDNWKKPSFGPVNLRIIYPPEQHTVLLPASGQPVRFRSFVEATLSADLQRVNHGCVLSSSLLCIGLSF